MPTAIHDQTTRVHNQDVYYKEVGEGPALLLIHGFLVSGDEWRCVLPLLAPYFRCIVPDLPGFGRSSKPSPDSFDYTPSNYAQILADFIESLGLESCHVVGHSMGGGLALRLAIDHPNRVERLAVMDAAWHPFSLPLKGRLAYLPKVGEFVFKKLYGRALVRDYFVNDVYNGKEVDMAQIDTYYDALDSPEARNAAYQVMQTVAHQDNLRDLAAEVSKVRHPTLVLWGDEDRLFPVSLGDKLSRTLPDAHLAVLEHCGHAGNEEQPEETAAALRKHFLDAETTQEAAPQPSLSR